MGLSVHRGFESPPLRWTSPFPSISWGNGPPPPRARRLLGGSTRANLGPTSWRAVPHPPFPPSSTAPTRPRQGDHRAHRRKRHLGVRLRRDEWSNSCWALGQPARRSGDRSLASQSDDRPLLHTPWSSRVRGAVRFDGRPAAPPLAVAPMPLGDCTTLRRHHQRPQAL
jgi:hypothetical protein